MATSCATVPLCSVEGNLPSIGKPISNTELLVLGGAQELVPVGVKGELYIGGVGLGRGYLGRADLTAEKFVPHPYSSEAGARLYRTGDVVRHLSDGDIDFIGRADNQVKIRGNRIEPGEIEAVLKEHPHVRQAVVQPRKDDNGELRLVAYVVLATSGNGFETNVPGKHEWREFLKQHLPAYMIPAAFVTMPGLPLTANGKVDRNALPAPEEVASTTVYVPPKTAVEEILCGIWCEVLGVEQVGTTENFFDLGGHSLLATQITARIREAFQVELPLRTLLEANTIASLAEGIEQALRTGTLPPAPPLVPVNRDGVLPLSFAQQRLWFIDQLEPGGAVYNIPAAIRLTGHLDRNALQESLNRMTARHEILRTTFITEGGKARARISQPEPFSMPVTDLTAVLPDEKNDEARRMVREEVVGPFDLTHGPLLRVKLIALQPEEHVLLLVMHHIIADGWSIGVLIRELSALYNAIADGREPELQDLAVQYVDYASWQREWLRDEVLQEQLSYWRQRLEGAPPLLDLPADRPRPATPTHRGGQERLIVPADVSRSLRELSKREGVTLFMLLLAAFKVLLMRYSGHTDVVVGTPIAGRRHKEVEGLIGLFVNALVMRTDLSGDPRFKDLLKRVKETCLGAFSHQDVPFEKLVDELQPERASSHSPLFQVVFAMQNVPRERIALTGLEASGAGIEGEIAKFDLTLVISEAEDSLIGGLEYNCDLFDRERISRLANHFQTILASIVSDPRQQLSEIPLLSDEETVSLDEADFSLGELNRQDLESFLMEISELRA